ncbi:hypothetical protein BpHYR1_027692 [Brachionus plicatilis]|uniref:Uncharacterized protein n=1 Tax=Brachionus plicatilis TaxID=10195 RepID=A0A3M7PER3_BRAPC|nr:hypothetical protein BpHYR1_027692 [Brachionus plicatilis]
MFRYLFKSRRLKVSIIELISANEKSVTIIGAIYCLTKSIVVFIDKRYLEIFNTLWLVVTNSEIVQ